MDRATLSGSVSIWRVEFQAYFDEALEIVSATGLDAHG